MINLNKRQLAVYNLVRKNSGIGTKEINRQLKELSLEEVSRVTVIRDLDLLLRKKLVRKEGEGRSVIYWDVVKNKLLTYFNGEEYFKKGPDERTVAYPRFNFEVFNSFLDLFSAKEIKKLEEENNDYRERFKKIPESVQKKELERLTTELSWKSSQIEGNTYSLIDTEILFKEKKEASGHKKEEAVMLLNHKKALDYINQNKEKFNNLSLKNLENIHQLIVGDLGIATGIRSGLVGITGTIYRPLDNQFQIKEALEKTIIAIQKIDFPLAKALVTVLALSYIQPFYDGNKRTARIMGNAILLAHNFCPLSYRSVNEGDYKKAILLFYEQNSALSFRELFTDQFSFAVNNYFI
jgi:Fic family protein